MNPYKARYWLDLATAYQAMDNLHDQKNAVDRAVVSDPKTPEVAWDAANFYLVQGDQDKALREFHVVLENDPSLAPAALRLCWKMSPDVDAMLNGFLPPNPQVYYDFLDLLMAKKETASAAKVWHNLRNCTNHCSGNMSSIIFAT